MSKVALWTTAAMFLLAGCSKEDVETKAPSIVIDQSLAIFDGKVAGQGSVEESGQTLWMVRIVNGEGASVVLYWLQEEIALYRAEGTTGPYDENYDVLPGNGLINFRSAELAARSALKNSNLREWLLMKEESFSDLWVYTLSYDRSGGTTERAYVSASSGDVLAID